MQIDGVHVALRYRGTRDLPGAAVSYLYGRLKNLASTTTGPFQQAFTLNIDDRQTFCRLYVDAATMHLIDIVDDTCSDLDGFLLWRKSVLGVNTYFGAFTDGTSEEIKPLADQTGDERLAGWEIPPIIMSSPYNLPPISSSLYSGQMREVVQCYYMGRDFNPFGYLNDKTHGIMENPERNPEEDPAPGDFYVIEISSQGVYAAPVKGGSRCCDSWDVTDYLAGEGEPPAYRSVLNLAWNALLRAPEKRPTVYTLIPGSAMLPVYNLGEPFSPLAGWAFSRSGRQAQQVLQREEFNGFDFGTTAENRYDCSRIKLTFDVVDGIPTGSVAIVETGRKCTFHRPNNVLWVPSALQNGTYDGIYVHLNEVNGQDAPVHVFYTGEQERVLRYSKFTSDIAAIDVGGAANVNGDFVGINVSGVYFRCPLAGPLTYNTCYTYNRYTRSSYSLRQSGFRLTGSTPPVDAIGVSTGSYNEFIGNTSMSGEESEGDLGTFNNFAALVPGVDPDCYRCGCPCAGTHVQEFEFFRSRASTQTETKNGISEVTASAAVLPQFEREGAVLLKSVVFGMGSYAWQTQQNWYRVRTEFTDHSCTPSAVDGVCCTYSSYNEPACQGGGSAGPLHNATVTTGLGSGDFQGIAVMRGKLFSQLLPTQSGGNPDGPYAQAMFWNKDNHTSIQLPLQVIGGGLYYEEEDDELAVDRETGYVFADAKGEFVYDGQPVTFVGRL